jgi:hypothetical protein
MKIGETSMERKALWQLAMLQLFVQVLGDIIVIWLEPTIRAYQTTASIWI